MKPDTEESYLDLVVRRAHLALRARPALAFPALQYRLCEVGPRRLDPIQLRNALDLLTGSSGELRKYSPGIYSDVSEDRSVASAAARRTEAVISALAVLDIPTMFTDLRQCLSSALKASSISIVSAPRLRQLTPASAVTACSGILNLDRRNSAPESVWFSWDVDWIYPHDDRLWKFLEECATLERHPVIIARKIAPITFPLFKALNVMGLQYYWWLVPDGQASALAKRADSAGWAPVRDVGSLVGAPVLSHVQRAVMERPAELPDAVKSRAAMAGAQFGLTGERTATPASLSAWASATEITLPERWLQSVHRAAIPGRPGLNTFPSSLPGHVEPEHTLSPEPNTLTPANAGDSNDHIGYGRNTKITRVPMRI